MKLPPPSISKMRGTMTKELLKCIDTLRRPASSAIRIRGFSIAVVTTLLCFGALAIRSYTHASSSAIREKSTTAMSGASVNRMTQSSERLEAEVITIRPTGFEPSEITRPIGPFVLAIENRSGLQAMQLRLDRVGVARLLDFEMPRPKHDWNNRLDLPPGRYVLSDAYHPDWACSITITAK